MLNSAHPRAALPGAGQSEKHFLATSTSGQPFRAEVECFWLCSAPTGDQEHVANCGALAFREHLDLRLRCWALIETAASASCNKSEALRIRNGEMFFIFSFGSFRTIELRHHVCRPQGLNPSSLKRLCHTGMVTRGIKPERTWLLVSQM